MKTGWKRNIVLFTVLLTLLLTLSPAVAYARYVPGVTSESSGADPAEPDRVEIARAAAGEKEDFSREESIKAIIAFLRKEMGLNDHAAAAILANMDRESGFDHRQIGDQEKAYGLCQWNRGRWDALILFCDREGLDWTTLEGQLAFLKHDLQARLPAMYEHLLQGCEASEKGALKAAYYFCLSYEAPLELEDEQEKRAKLTVETYLPLLEQMAQEAETVPEETPILSAADLILPTEDWLRHGEN